MKLQEVFDQLSASELVQVSIGGQAAGVINEANWSKVVSHVNLGLMALYKRFTLKEGTLALELQHGQTLYNLISAFAVNGKRTTQPVRYILDTADDPFMDDILKVEKVVCTDTDFEMSLNQASDPYSVVTPSSLKLRVPAIIVSGSPDTPDELKTSQLTLSYRAAHPKVIVPLGYFDPTRVDLQLPDSHLEPLLYFIAGRIHTPMGMGQTEGVSANAYMAHYERACQALEGQGLEVDQGEGNTRLVANGWV